MSERNPLLGHCRSCGYVWAMAWLPLEATTAGRLAKAGCSACGERKSIFVATASQAAAWRDGPRGEPCFFKEGASS